RTWPAIGSPELNRAILKSLGQLAVTAPGQTDGSPLAGDREDRSRRAVHLPQAHAAIQPRRGKAFTIRAPLDTKHDPAMPSKDGSRLAVCVPEPRRVVSVARNQPFAIGAPGDGEDCIYRPPPNDNRARRTVRRP